MTVALSADDATQLLQLCEAGRLYEVEQWIRSGRSLTVAEQFRKTPLKVAMKTRFHSLIELLLRHEECQIAKNDVLSQALQMRRSDLVKLAVQYGAETSSVPFVNVLLSWDRGLATLFLERGADPIADVPFAQAFCERVRTALGCYLDCRRRHPDLASQLQEQADIALRQLCRDGSLKWVSLLLWVGADPRSHGPTLDYDDPEMETTALHEASNSGHLDILKRLSPDATRDDLSDLLYCAAMSAHQDVLSYLLGLGANPNDKDNGGSRALDGCLRHLGWEDLDAVLYGRHYRTPAYKVSKTRASIRLLLEHGAAWKPDDSLADLRRTLCRIDAEVTVELAELFVKHRACDDATLHQLLRTPRMQQHMASSEDHLAHVGLSLDGRRRSWQKSRNASPSPYVLNQYDRERLYSEVWAEPTQKVAKRYGISDVRLATVCRQLRIPKPPRGYWAKKAAGQPLPRLPKLPLLEDAKRTSQKGRAEPIR